MSDVLQRPPREPFVPPGGYELLARDMTATFSADCTLRLAQEKLGEIGQWLPVDGDPDATLGSLVERNSSGPRGRGYGGGRELHHRAQ
jgi:FAD/FMN-containing dehydrogenase